MIDITRVFKRREDGSKKLRALSSVLIHDGWTPETLGWAWTLEND